MRDARAQMELAALAEPASSPEERKAAASCAVLAARRFERLIAIKDASQYGFEDLSGQALLAARRNARALIEFAEGVLSH